MQMRSYKMYKQFLDRHGNVKTDWINRLSDNAYIPFDPANTDYQEYLRFLAEGGQPLPADNDGQTAE
jgi:hypothetical protein